MIWQVVPRYIDTSRKLVLVFMIWQVVPRYIDTSRKLVLVFMIWQVVRIASIDTSRKLESQYQYL